MPAQLRFWRRRVRRGLGLAIVAMGALTGALRLADLWPAAAATQAQATFQAPG